MAKDTRARMLETTARLLQHRGFYGTALSDILEQSGAPRGSLYFHFPGGKEELVLEATRASIKEASDALRAALALADNPAKAVRLYIEEAGSLMRASDYTFGCPVAPVILDASAGLSELAEICRAAFDEWAGLLRVAFVGAGMAEPRAGALAFFVVATIEGLLVLARAYRDCSALTAVAVELEAAVAAALPKRARDRASESSRKKR
jgi:TetR/AcrR family transcriptional repressor of lmrAB and yxaGH operons